MRWWVGTEGIEAKFFEPVRVWKRESLSLNILSNRHDRQLAILCSDCAIMLLPFFMALGSCAAGPSTKAISPWSTGLAYLWELDTGPAHKELP
jgi:hypothetical protein